jgi:hypothetical protein
MELIGAIGLLVMLALAAPRWGHDSRRLHSGDGWFGAPRPRRPGRSGSGATATAAWSALAGAPVRVMRGARRAGGALRAIGCVLPGRAGDRAEAAGRAG